MNFVRVRAMKPSGLALVALLGLACAPGAPLGASSPGAPRAPEPTPWPSSVPAAAPSIYTLRPPSPAPQAYAEALAKPSLPILRSWSGSSVDGNPPEGDLVARTQAEWRSGLARFVGLAAATNADEAEPDFTAEMRLVLVRIWGNDRSRLEIVTIEELVDRIVVHSVLADDDGMFVSPRVSHPFDIVDCPTRAKPVVFAAPIRVHWAHLPEGRIRPAVR